MTRRLPLTLLAALPCAAVLAYDPIYTDGDSLHIRLPDETHFYRYGGSLDIDPICSVGSKYVIDPPAKEVRYICIEPSRVLILPAHPPLGESVLPESRGWRVHVHEELGYWSGQVPNRVIEYRGCNLAIPPAVNPDGTPPAAFGYRNAWNCMRIGFPLILFESGFEGA